MKAEPFILTPEHRSRALDVLGTRVTVLASNAQTGSYEITLQQGDEGTGPPLHSHGWDEAFFILSGSIEFTCAGVTRVCVPGTLVHVPAGTLHGFRYGAGGGEMLELTGAGGRAAQMFTSIDEEAPPGPAGVAKAVEVLQRNGVTIAS